MTNQIQLIKFKAVGVIVCDITDCDSTSSFVLGAIQVIVQSGFFSLDQHNHLAAGHKNVQLTVSYFTCFAISVESVRFVEKFK